MLLNGFFALGVASLALAARPVRRVAHETRRSLPTGWTPIRRAEPDRVLPLSVGLVQSNLENLEAYLLDVSHPDSPNYGQHWTPARVADTFRPSPASVDAVRTWLVEDGQIGVDRIALSGSGAWLVANVTVDEAEQLLGTEYYVYQHEEDGREHLACHQGYHLPEHVSKHVDLITPTLHFDTKVTRHGSAEPAPALGSAKNIGKVAGPQVGGVVHNFFSDLETCDQAITLACLRVLYDFVYTPIAPQKNTIGVVEYTPQSHNATDFDVFFANYSKSQIGERPRLVPIDGGVLVPGGDAAESSLDLQYVLGLIGSKKQEVQLYQVGDTVEGASFNNLLDGLDKDFCTTGGGDDPTQDGIYPDTAAGGYKGEDCGTVKPAHIISTSYGYQEADLTPAYMQRQCAEYGKISLTGVTFVYSSGDAGVGGRQNVCLNESGEQVVGGKIFSPTFPGGCPFVTSVGATQVVPGHKVTDPESAVFQRFPSGGGFSNVFPRADFQKGAVANYLEKFPPGYAPGIFNTTGRAHPDVSANGLNFSVAIDGQFRLVSGTSASAPAFAAILSAVNDARLAIGKSPVGWINPAVYSSFFTGAFNDITNGSNPNCGTQGFLAKPGWDPVTGLGTPNFPKLLSRFLLLP
ncbi:subtilisin-like protein [Trametes versicolor FP-101664 SS1]|uniref:subtilisin-like protein n=1 Tax=Trametes versicolor (strain FP-101664) TaxID=717944 RepID=UPI0004622291|nr:subtilisin-like protein [Trametes versicolor FP-101664 SS1]EIW53707.1 subtilisin-like protein [Trametes versicolor FP-101664 SS1]